MYSEIESDRRLIYSIIHGEGRGATLWAVGNMGVEKIESYGENGYYCSIPFYRIFVNGKIKYRVPALNCIVTYMDSTDV